MNTLSRINHWSHKVHLNYIVSAVVLHCIASLFSVKLAIFGDTASAMNQQWRQCGSELGLVTLATKSQLQVTRLHRNLPGRGLGPSPLLSCKLQINQVATNYVEHLVLHLILHKNCSILHRPNFEETMRNHSGVLPSWIWFAPGMAVPFSSTQLKSYWKCLAPLIPP